MVNGAYHIRTNKELFDYLIHTFQRQFGYHNIYLSQLTINTETVNSLPFFLSGFFFSVVTLSLSIIILHFLLVNSHTHTHYKRKIEMLILSLFYWNGDQSDFVRCRQQRRRRWRSRFQLNMRSL